MKIIEAINKLDNSKPNTYTTPEKIAWLSELDGRIKKEIIDTHEAAEEITFNGYTDNDTDTELLVPSPYDDIYIRWLEAYVDYSNGEYGKYNNSMAMFNAKYSSYEKYYNRNHMPIGTKIKYF